MSTVAPRTVKITTCKVGNASVEKDIPIPDGLSVQEDGQERQSFQGMFTILNKTDGDKRVVWDSQSLREISDAKEMFVTLVEEGMRPYRVGPNGEMTDVVMQEFDANAEEIIFAPDQKAVLVGG